ncbi:hypothetical protein [Rhodococcus daqingensis]|uniref:Signal transduction histidine kinase n=1 Tax=Rhodococcus daqingensis TaxID=2479363 RepID=A0ABW2RSE3_9NOCA
MTAQPGTRDVRELLGLHTRGAKALVAAYVLTFLLVSLSTSPGPDAVVAELTAWLVVSAGAVTLVRIAGDPLPFRPAVALTLAGAIALNLVLPVLPVPIDGLLQTWPLGAGTAILAYLCVRGRIALGWLGMAAMLASCALWAMRTGQGAGYGLGMSAINMAPLLMATFVAYTVRPSAKAIFELREQTTRRIAAEAADAAVLEERDRQLRRLDELARPLLDRIATGVDLDEHERIACRLLEAHLRDILRAPGLSDPAVAAAARAARGRGVEVILLDDRGADDAVGDAPQGLLGMVAAELAAASDGAVTVRVLPPGRSAMATVLASGTDRVRRTEFGHGGRAADAEASLG